MNRTPARTSVRRATTSAAALAVMVGLAGLVAPSASAEPLDITDASFTWAPNDETGGGAYFGGCNFLVAGSAGNSGSSRLWTEADGFYATQVGNVTIEKPTADGGWAEPTWATKCQNSAGTTVSPSAGSTTGNRMVFENGTGTVDVEAGTAQIQWEGDVTIVFYGGLTYWTASNPTLTVSTDGTATLTATAGGYGADMYDTTLWVELEPTEITLATLGGVDVTESGFTATPDYLGVEVDISDGTPQVRTGSWGSFPQDFVDFQVLTGQSSYWYSSGGAADPKKVAKPTTFSWTLPEDEGTGEPEPGDSDGIDVDVTVPTVDDEEPGEPGEPEEPGEFSWVVSGSSVQLGTATVNEDGSFSATGALPSITVTDTREDSPSWTLSGSASSFVAGSNSFSASALGWVPTVAANSTLAGPAVAPGTVGLGQAQVLAQAASGDAVGEVEVNATLNLLAPAGTTAGDYRSTLTLTALG